MEALNSSRPTRRAPHERPLDRACRGWPLTTVLLLAACTTPRAPVDQVRYFSQAFTAVNAVGQPLLDDLALAERAQGQRNAQTRAKKNPPMATGPSCASDPPMWVIAPANNRLGFIDGLCLEDASYFAELGDPVATAQLRGGLHVIERYADVLSALAEGRNIPGALADVTALGQEVGGLIALSGANVAVGAALTALQPVLAHIARETNAAQARQLVIEGSQTVHALIVALRNAVPDMFRTLIERPTRDLGTAQGAQAALKEIAARRTVVSQYTVLLGRLDNAWSATVTAANHPESAHLADLVAQTAALRADADAVRRSLAVLRGPASSSP